MSLKTNAELIKTKINEGKAKLKLPESASLQEFIDKVGTGGAVYNGFLPNNSYIGFAPEGLTGIKIIVKSVDANATGTRVHYKANEIPGLDSNTYIDIPKEQTSHIFTGLNENSKYGFRCESYVMQDEDKFFNNAKGLGTQLLANTAPKVTGAMFIAPPTETAGKEIFLYYSKYTSTIYLTCNNILYKLNSEFSWEQAATNIFNYLFITPHGIFSHDGTNYNGAKAKHIDESTLAVRELSGALCRDFRTTAILQKDNTVIIGTGHSSYSDIKRYDTTTKDFVRIGGCNISIVVDLQDKVYISGSSKYVGSYLFSYNFETKTLDIVKEKWTTSYTENVADLKYKVLNTDTIAFSMGNKFVLVKNDIVTSEAFRFKKARIEQICYLPSDNHIYYPGEDNYMYVFTDDLSNVTRVETTERNVENKMLVYGDFVYSAANGGSCVYKTKDRITTAVAKDDFTFNTGTYGVDLIVGADNVIYVVHEKLGYINESGTISFIKDEGGSAVKISSCYYREFNPPIYNINIADLTYISFYKLDGLHCIKDGKLVKTVTTKWNAYSIYGTVNGVNYFTTTNASAPQMSHNPADNTVAEITEFKGGIEVLTGRIYNNVDIALYGFNKLILDITSTPLTLVSDKVNNFAYGKQTDKTNTGVLIISEVIK